jgi:ABC-type uncharacterized transport system permease subunit
MSSVTVLNILTIGFYLAAAALLFGPLRAGTNQDTSGKSRWRVGILALAGLILHGALLHRAFLLDSAFNLSMTSVSLLISWVAVFMLFTASIARPLESLGIAVLPVAALTVGISWLIPGEQVMSRPMTAAQSAHIVISLISYSLVFLAALQSVLLLIQERHLRQHHPGGFIRALPPMETMEDLMFLMIRAGLALLTLTVVSGVFFTEALFGKPLTFTHHTILSIAAWLVFAILVIGHWRFGWRGRTAIRWTIIGFLLLILAYFGSKFVFEIVRGP